MQNIDPTSAPPTGTVKLFDLWYAPAGFAVLRTPLLPLNAFSHWGDDLAWNGDSSNTGALAADRETLWGRLAVFFQDPKVREALFLASPDLEELLDEWASSYAKTGQQGVGIALVRYFQRMCCRPTPFGLFAGCSLIGLASRTNLDLAPNSSLRRKSRLDMDYLFKLVDQVAGIPDVRATLGLRVNSSLYRTAGKIRYIENRQGDRGRSHHLVSVTPDQYLDTALEAANGGTQDVIIAALQKLDPEIEFDEALEFVGELLTTQLLVSDLSLPVTGEELVPRLLRQLEANPAAWEFVAKLARATEELAAMDQAGPGVVPGRYRALKQILEDLPVVVKMQHLVQVDLWKPAPSACLSTRITSELLRGVQIIHAMNHPQPEPPLGKFVQEFQNRYEDREVPLAEVLDEESGIGFERSAAASAEGSPLLAGLPIARGESTNRVPWYPVYDLLLGKVQSALAAGETEIVLTPEAFEGLGPAQPVPLLDTFHVQATIHGRPGDDPGCGDDVRIHFGSFGGPSGATMLGRFCSLDEGLAAAVRGQLRHEEGLRPDAVFAEIVHLPEGRIGNILYRPLLRDHEIPYLCASGVDRDHQLPLEDLLVSVRNGKILLKSRRLGREIIPRLSSAHNYFNGAVGTYKFLCLLQNQGQEAFRSWVWGPLESMPFLPRVRCGRLIFSLATWGLNGKEIKEITAAGIDDGFRAVQELRTRKRLPRFMSVVDGDNAMPVDFDNPISVEVMRQLLKNRGSATLRELYGADEEQMAQGEGGGYCHELIVPFARVAQESKNDSEEKSLTKIRQPIVTLPVLRFPPGSEWLYVKLYCGTASADQVLRETVAPVVHRALAGGAASQWFFIRFSDPDWHLRLRFKGVPARLLNEVLPDIHRTCLPLIEQGVIRSLALDTYVPEQNRYGGSAGLSVCQSLFQIDSSTVLGLVEGFQGDQAAELRWLLALRGVDRLFSDLGFDLAGKLAVLDTVRERFWHEHNGHKYLRKAMGLKYRHYRTLIATAGAEYAADLSDSEDGELAKELRSGCRLIDAGSDNGREAARRLSELGNSNQLQLPLADIAASLAHMHCNRLLRSGARAQEMVIYDFLCREYRSKLARAAKQSR